MAAVASTFGSPARLKILQILAQSPRSVESVAELTGESIANASQHLRRLLNLKIVSVKRNKLSHIYRLSDDTIAMLIEGLFDLAEKTSPELLEAETCLIEEAIGRPVPLHAALDEIRNNKAVFLDVRDETEAHASAVQGALSLPLNELKQSASTLEREKIYYLFCRGRSCSAATEGVKLLRALGFRACRIKESPAAIRTAMNRNANLKTGE